MERVVLIAPEGMCLTNGEICGKTIFLADGLDPNAFYEVTEEEAERAFENNTRIGHISDAEALSILTGGGGL